MEKKPAANNLISALAAAKRGGHRISSRWASPRKNKTKKWGIMLIYT